MDHTCKVNFNCASQLGKALKANTSLTQLSIAGFGLSLDGEVEIARALTANSTLQSIAGFELSHYARAVLGIKHRGSKEKENSSVLSLLRETEEVNNQIS
jgi:hypothetical protein